MKAYKTIRTGQITAGDVVQIMRAEYIDDLDGFNAKRPL